MNKLYLLLFLAFISSCQEKKEGIKASYKDMTLSVYASATVTPANLYKLHSTVSGNIENIYNDVGDTVYTDQLIAKIKSGYSEADLKSARISTRYSREMLKGSNNLLSNISAKINLAQRQLSLDSLNLQRQIKLNKKGIGSQIELDRLRLQHEQSKQSLIVLKREYRQTKTRLENEYHISKNSEQKANLNQNDYHLRSHIDGRIYKLFKEQGELITPQEPFAIIGSQDSFIIEMLIDEVDIVQVELGQKVIINLSAYEGEVFEARISKIGPTKEEVTQTFKIEATFITPPKSLYSGLTGEASIITSTKRNTLVIPIEYLIHGKTVLTDKGEKEVTTGAKNMDEIEILSGLDSSTYILLP